jgi:N-methylhydantoinase A
MLLGVDVGGTFTDAVLATDRALVSAKALTTPEDQSLGVMAAVSTVLERAGSTAEQVRFFAHGMTVATNALLEGRSAPVALLVTEGFTDIVELGRQARPQLYRLCVAAPPPLTPPERRLSVPERMGPEGTIRALTAEAADGLARALAELQVSAAAVVLLHSWRHPAHELALGEAIARAAPAVSVHLSHQAVGTFREYERAATTEIDAGLSPLLAGYLRRLRERAQAAGLPLPRIMQSNGGLIDLERAAAHAALTILSGPAGGAAGAALLAGEAGVPDALCLDMGGTSCDVCVVQGGRVAERSEGTVAGRPIALPMLAVHTVGAGGGSIAWRDSGGALRVGPRSAGADPGPACYGRGGVEPTVTDANLVLGHLDADRPLAGGVKLDREAAEGAIDGLARSLDLDRRSCALGIRRVACATIAAALRLLTVRRGIDPRRHAVLAFGGAGPLHATDVADELGIDRVLVPRSSGVLAAVGLLAAPQRRDVQRSVLLAGERLTAGALERSVERLAGEARAALDDDRGAARIETIFETRYEGQSFELAVSDPSPLTPRSLRAAFEAEHERRYGYRDPEQEIELVTIRVSATLPAARLQLGYEQARDPIEGPRNIRLPESTLLVPAGWRGTFDQAGTIHLRRTVSVGTGGRGCSGEPAGSGSSGG